MTFSVPVRTKDFSMWDKREHREPLTESFSRERDLASGSIIPCVREAVARGACPTSSASTKLSSTILRPALSKLDRQLVAVDGLDGAGSELRVEHAAADR